MVKLTDLQMNKIPPSKVPMFIKIYCWKTYNSWFAILLYYSYFLLQMSSNPINSIILYNRDLILLYNPLNLLVPLSSEHMDSKERVNHFLFMLTQFQLFPILLRGKHNVVLVAAQPTINHILNYKLS